MGCLLEGTQSPKPIVWKMLVFDLSARKTAQVTVVGRVSLSNLGESHDRVSKVQEYWINQDASAGINRWRRKCFLKKPGTEGWGRQTTLTWKGMGGTVKKKRARSVCRLLRHGGNPHRRQGSRFVCGAHSSHNKAKVRGCQSRPAGTGGACIRKQKKKKRSGLRYRWSVTR